MSKDLSCTVFTEIFSPPLRRQKALEEEERERKKEERLRKREQKLREREERKNLKKLRRQQEEEQKKLQMKIAMEERRLLLAQRNLESIRLIAELLARAKVGRSRAEQGNWSGDVPAGVSLVEDFYTGCFWCLPLGTRLKNNSSCRS